MHSIPFEKTDSRYTLWNKYKHHLDFQFSKMFRPHFPMKFPRLQYPRCSMYVYLPTFGHGLYGFNVGQYTSHIEYLSMQVGQVDYTTCKNVPETCTDCIPEADPKKNGSGGNVEGTREKKTQVYKYYIQYYLLVVGCWLLVSTSCCPAARGT